MDKKASFKKSELKELQLMLFGGEVQANAITGVIIDPGHGGKDGGGGTNQFWKESEYVLQLSLYQYRRFKELGVPVKMTRTSDVYLSPDQRVSIVNRSGMKHCISNHINAGKGDGAEFIYSKFAKPTLGNLMAEEIKNMGQNVRRVFTRSLNNGLDYYFMNRETNTETVIAEYGFADSKLDDVVQLRTKQLDYAEAVVKAYCRYIGHTYKAPYIPAAATPAPKKEVKKGMNLADWQFEELEAAFKYARENEIFTSDRWEQQAKDESLSTDQAVYAAIALWYRTVKGAK